MFFYVYAALYLAGLLATFALAKIEQDLKPWACVVMAVLWPILIYGAMIVRAIDATRHEWRRR